MKGVLHTIIKRCMAVAVLLCLLPIPVGLATTAVDSAPLTTQSGTTNGMVRVYLSSLGNPSALTLTIAGSYTVNGNASQSLPSGSRVTVGFSSATGNLTLTRDGVSTSMGTYFAIRRHSATGSNGVKIAQARQPGNPYPGDISFRAVRQSNGTYKLYTVAHVFMENYLYGVLPYEMGNSAGLEALKAQAVAARTYTLRMMNARASGYYDVVDTTSDQVYNGTPSGNANCVAAIDATKGVVVMNDSALTMTYYSASNGGQTESASNLWGSKGYGYLGVKDDPFDYQNPACTVKKTTVYASCANAAQNAGLMALLRTKAIAALCQKGYSANAGNTTLSAISSILPHTPKYASPSRLYTKMDFTLTASTLNSQGYSVSATVTVTCGIFTELEKLLGMSIQSSSNELWTVRQSGGNFVLEARRYGHGIGMSQRGAMYMSKLGYSYDQILGFYYPGCRRVRHSLTNTILSAVGSGTVMDQTTVEEAAQLDESGSGSNATVTLVSSSASLAIRAEKSLTGKVLGTAAYGAPVQVLSNDGGWCFIRYGGVKGYVPAEALRITGAVSGGEESVSQILCYATVTGTNALNLRSQGSYSGTILTTIPSGTVLTVFSKASGWAYVQFGSTVAYACTDYLTFSDQYPGELADSASVNAVVTLQNTTETVNFRASPDTSAAILAALPHGTQVVVTADDGAWCAVTYNGQQGYIIAQYLTRTGATTTPMVSPSQPVTDLLPGETMATVAGDGGVLKLWSQTSTESTLMAEVANGKSIVVTQRGDPWCAVRYEGLTGYAATNALRFAESSVGTQTSLTATVVTASGSLNMRSEGRAGSTILTTIPRGATVSVSSRGGTWCAVSYGGLSGYAMSQFLQFADGGASTTAPVSGAVQTARVTTASGSLNLRQLPKAGSRILRTIPQYASVTVLGQGVDWCQVSYEGTVGHVMSVFLTFTGETTPAPSDTSLPATDTPAPSESPAPSDGATTEGATDTPTPAPTDVPTGSPTTLFAVVTTASGSLNLRQDALPGSPVLTRIPKGVTIEVSERLSAWSRVSYMGQTGYVMNAFLTFQQTGGAVTLPSSAQTGATTGSANPGLATVNTASGSLNLRREPASGSEVLTRVPQYASVRVHTQGATWCYVDYNGLYGYVMTHYLLIAQAGATATAAPSVSLAPAQSATALTAWVATSSGSLNLRQQPVAGSQVLTTIPQYAAVTVTQRGDDWCSVIYNSFAGYVQSRYLAFAAQTTQATAQTQPPTQTVAPAQTLQPTTEPTPTPAPTLEPVELLTIDPTLVAVLEPTTALCTLPEGTTSLSMYAQCSEQSEEVAELVNGAQAVVLMRGDTWLMVKVDQATGYCLKQFMVIQP